MSVALHQQRGRLGPREDRGTAAPCQVIVLGPPGSGKTTHATRLAERLGLPHLNLGFVLRELAAEETGPGREIAGLVADGRLVPDRAADQLVREWLESLPPERGFVLEGYPRNVAQAHALRRLLTRLERLRSRPTVVQLDVPRDQLVRRLARRRGREGRTDDTGEAIARRQELDDAARAPVLDAMAEWADVVHVGGDGPLEAVAEQILNDVRCAT
jgi:adenylate kinase